MEQRLIMALDMLGYEQDGCGLDFIDHNDGGKIVSFASVDEMYTFVCDKIGNRLP